MVVTSTGNVGIGTTAPSDKLDVVGSLHVDYGNTNSGTVGNTLGFGDGSSLEAIGSSVQRVETKNGLDFYTFGVNRMSITNTGLVGVGRVPTTYALEVQGDACKTSGGSTWLVCSDRRIKTEIETIENALDTIGDLRLVEYRYTPEYLAQNPGTEDKVYYNVIAQEYAEVFPEYVKARADDGILQVDTHPALIHTIAAVQELKRMVQERDQEIASIRAKCDQEIASMRDSMARMEEAIASLSASN